MPLEALELDTFQFPAISNNKLDTNLRGGTDSHPT